MDWKSDDAPITHLEVVKVYRPTRVVAALCCFICTVLLIISICPTAWMETTTDPDGILKNREGLFKICPQTLVEDELQKDGSCINQTLGFMKTVAALIIVSWMLTIVAGGIIVGGMMSGSDYFKLVVYRAALVLTIISGVMILAALITFPVMVGRKLDETVIETTWSIGWAYMLDWAALVINVVAIVLLSIDRNPDEMSLREKMADQ